MSNQPFLSTTTAPAFVQEIDMSATGFVSTVDSAQHKTIAQIRCEESDALAAEAQREMRKAGAITFITTWFACYGLIAFVEVVTMMVF